MGGSGRSLLGPTRGPPRGRRPVAASTLAGVGAAVPHAASSVIFMVDRRSVENEPDASPESMNVK